MEQQEMREILNQVASGSLSTEDALLKLKMAPFEELDIATLDHHRGLRQGASEVIYGAGKTPEQIDIIAHRLWESGQKTILITRMSEEAEKAFNRDIPFTYYKEGRIGGTSDIPVAEEAALTAQILGNHVERIYDVGVAGIHRLLSHTEKIMKARVIIAIAGMEGALASVIGGLADCPVIAVPTSVGYGTALGGVTALLSMLNSCASGVSVVNIDNGFGAGYLASLINNMEGEKTE